MGIEVGLQAVVEHVVTAQDTAEALGSGDVAVFGTPAVVALCERASVAAIAPALEPGQTTVGTNVHVEHLAPTAVGRHVEARARLERFEGRVLYFSVEASDSAGQIARGTHTRSIVDRDRFVRTADERP